MTHVYGHYFIRPVSLTLPAIIPMGVCTGHSAAMVFYSKWIIGWKTILVRWSKDPICPSVNCSLH